MIQWDEWLLVGAEFAPWCFILASVLLLLSAQRMARLHVVIPPSDPPPEDDKAALARSFVLRGLASGRSPRELLALAHMKFGGIDPLLVQQIQAELRRVTDTSTERPVPPKDDSGL